MKNPWLKLSGVGLAAMLGLGTPAVALANEGEAGSKFISIDANGDGQISAAEFEAVTDRKFVEIDANRDGRVTVMEMDNYKAKAHKEKADKGWDARYTSASQVKKLDTNGDGSLTEVEFAAGGQIKFDEMDSNHDGLVSKTEWEAGHAKHKSGK